jgi:hypothetical protein
MKRSVAIAAVLIVCASSEALAQKTAILRARADLCHLRPSL